MSIDKTLEVKGNFDEWQVTTRYDTDEYERENWSERQSAGKGFIRENGKLVSRAVARIPIHDAAMLRANYDLDYLAFENGDRNALRRLLKRFPYWQTCEGSV